MSTNQLKAIKAMSIVGISPAEEAHDKQFFIYTFRNTWVPSTFSQT